MEYYDNYGSEDNEMIYIGGYLLFEHYDGLEFGDNKTKWKQTYFLLSTEDAYDNPFYNVGTSPSPHEFHNDCIRHVDKFIKRVMK